MARKTGAKKKVTNVKKDTVGKKTNKGGTVSPEDSDIQRIEALEATIDALQSDVLELKKSLGGLLDVGLDNEEISRIISSSIEGRVTGVNGCRIEGWAINRVDHISPMPISVFYGGKKVASAIANRTLETLSGIPAASGNAFSIILPKQFYDGKARSLRFKAGNVEAEIGNNVGSVSFNDGFPIEGGIMKNSRGVIEGWAVDHSAPKSPIVVGAIYGGEELFRVLADIKVESLSKKLGKSNCHHGFRIELPREMGDGKKRNVRIVASRWGYDVMDSPVECKFSRK